MLRTLKAQVETCNFVCRSTYRHARTIHATTLKTLETAKGREIFILTAYIALLGVAFSHRKDKDWNHVTNSVYDADS